MKIRRAVFLCGYCNSDLDTVDTVYLLGVFPLEVVPLDVRFSAGLFGSVGAGETPGGGLFFVGTTMTVFFAYGRGLTRGGREGEGRPLRRRE